MADFPRSPNFFRTWRADAAYLYIEGTWIWPGGQVLLTGQDQLPFSQEDWPNPRAPGYAISLRTLIDETQVDLIGQDLLPVRQPDWPVPKGPRYPIDLRFWGNVYYSQLTFVTQPFSQDDWPVPKGSQQGATDLRSWTWSYNLNLVGQDQFPHNQDEWPNPRAPLYSIDLRGWLSSGNALSAPTTVSPFNQMDWPLTFMPPLRDIYSFIGPLLEPLQPPPPAPPVVAYTLLGEICM